MIVYTVYEPRDKDPDIEKRADSVVLVKEGFTWWGFLFGPFWLLFNRLWLEFVAAILLALVIAVGLSRLGLGEEAPGTVNFLLMLLVGFEGNDLKRWRLQRKGYEFITTVAGRDMEECERRFYDAWLPSVTATGAGRVLWPTTESPPERNRDRAAMGVIGTLPGATS